MFALISEFLYFQMLSYCGLASFHFNSRAPFSISLKLMNHLNFYVFGSLYLSIFLRTVLLGIAFLVGIFSSHSALWIYEHTPLDCKVSSKKSADNLMGRFFHMRHFTFFLVALKFFVFWKLDYNLCISV